MERQTAATVEKPPYRVPTMAEIAAVPWNGLNLVSTFSGAGGACLGYRMAGFRVRYANEFIPAARDTYALNSPDTPLDDRDIRIVQPEEILAMSGLEPGEIDVLEGSPPCASFSTAGKRESAWGKVKKYSDTEQRTDDLFHEYVRLLRALQPKVFQAENVSGLVKGTAKGYFLEILEALKQSGYNVKCAVVDSQWLGVPQVRLRTIFIGVRNDLKLEPIFPAPLPYRYSIRDALPYLKDAKVVQGGRADGGKVFGRPEIVLSSDEPIQTITRAGVGSKNFHCAKIIEDDPSIEKYAIGREWDKLHPGQSSKKFYNLVRPDPDKPVPTVTQTGGIMGAASVTHPTEKRKFTIAEIKRLCAFPDDFQLTGSFSQQWERCGRSVPPVMMFHIAAAIRDDILGKLERDETKKRKRSPVRRSSAVAPKRRTARR
jgi:DNA (cytosine-5)-methyltransferase 1